MADRTVIIHGWSDCSESFLHLKKCLTRAGLGGVRDIFYADYQSREDNVTFDDVVGGLNDALAVQGLLDGRPFNVVVHSTGGLVIRHWIWRYYRDRIDDCPVKNLVMLAPANFGSPLAHRGKSFLGRLFKGRWKIGDLLEVGQNLLSGLELASPHQWHLAHRDLLGDECFYGPERIRLTVLVGLDDYEGLRGWVNKPGTDGTVVIAGTPLNAIKVTLDFTKGRGPVCWEIGKNVARFGFGVLPGYDHGSIVSSFEGRPGESEDPLVRHTLSALRVGTPKQFEKHVEALEKVTRDAYAPEPAAGVKRPPPVFQQFLLRAVDDQGAPIRDFTLEFFVRRADRADEDNQVLRRTSSSTKKERELSEEANKRMCGEFHTYRGDSSFRRMLVDIAAVAPLVPEGYLLAMRLHVPKIDRGIYYDTANTQDVVIWEPGAGEGPTFFYPNTTTLVELVVDRRTDYVTVGTSPRSS